VAAVALLCTPSFRLLYTGELANNKIIRPRVGLYFSLPALLIAIAGIRGAAARGLPGRSSSAAGVAQNENRSAANPALSQAENALAGNRLDEALAKCREALAQDPKSARAYYILGIIQLRLGKPDEAKAAWLKAIQISPGSVDAHLAVGKLYLDTNNLADAAKEFQAAVKLGDPRGRARYGLALAFIGESKYQTALPLLQAAVEADPNDAERLFTLTATEFQLKQADQARRNLARLERLSAGDPWALSRIGKMLVERKMPREAEACFERSAELLAEGNTPALPDLRLSDLYLQIAQLRFSRSDYLGAIQYLNKVQPGSVEPDLEAARLDLLGVAFLALGRTQDARAQQMRAVQLAPCSRDFVSHLAWAELLSGDLQAATAAAETARAKWPQDPDVIEIAGIVQRESLPERKRVSFSQGWHLKGEGMVCCPCDTPCPCRSNAPPTHGHCESSGGFHIAHGHYGEIPLDGLTFVVVSGSMDTQSVPAVFYVDSSATTEQAIALEHIFQEFIPLHQFLSLDMRLSKVSFERLQEGKVYVVEVPDVIQMKIERQLDSNGKPLLRTAALDYFSNTLEYARNVIYKVSDGQADLKWDYSGRQANYRTIDLDSREYKDATMLIQYEDGSGYFTEKQLELIQAQKLPTLASYPQVKRVMSSKF
jgi:tetratricopeptide (TPR) repeat protein